MTTAKVKTKTKASLQARVKCRVSGCNFKGRFLQPHLKSKHGMTVAEYLGEFPTAKVSSPLYRKNLGTSMKFVYSHATS